MSDTDIAGDPNVEDEDEDDIIVGRLSALMPRFVFRLLSYSNQVAMITTNQSLSRRKLFLEPDAAVRKGILQVFVRMKPQSSPGDTCMQLDHSNLLKATWYGRASCNACSGSNLLTQLTGSQS